MDRFKEFKVYFQALRQLLIVLVILGGFSYFVWQLSPVDTVAKFLTFFFLFVATAFACIVVANQRAREFGRKRAEHLTNESSPEVRF